MNRREFLRTAGGAVGAAATAGGAAMPAASQRDPAALQENQTQTGGNQTAAGNGTAGGNQTDGGNQTQAGTGGGATETVLVGPNGELVFEEAEIVVEPGTTVIWQWESDRHNVAPTSIPEGATWEGHPDIANTGTTYRYTFETEGLYEYVCVPHEDLGMVGSVEVTTDASGGGGGGGGGGHEEQEPAEMGVQIQKHFVGAAAFMGIFSSLVFMFYLLKYGESAHTKAPGKRE